MRIRSNKIYAGRRAEKPFLAKLAFFQISLLLISCDVFSLINSPSNDLFLINLLERKNSPHYDGYTQEKKPFQCFILLANHRKQLFY